MKSSMKCARTSGTVQSTMSIMTIAIGPNINNLKPWEVGPSCRLRLYTGTIFFYHLRSCTLTTSRGSARTQYLKALALGCAINPSSCKLFVQNCEPLAFPNFIIKGKVGLSVTVTSVDCQQGAYTNTDLMVISRKGEKRHLKMTAMSLSLPVLQLAVTSNLWRTFAPSPGRQAV